VNCRLHSQFRHCIVLMVNRKSWLCSLCAHTSASERIPLNQLLLDEKNPNTAGKQEEKPGRTFRIGAKYRARYYRQWFADKVQGGRKFNRVEGDVYTGDDEQHGECVGEWPDSIFAPGHFQRQ